MRWLTTIAVTGFVVLLIQAFRLVRNVRLARRSHLPILLTPFLETEAVAFIIAPLLRRWYIPQLVNGEGWPRWCRFIIKDWTWEEKRLSHETYGETFLCVSPGGIICYSADAMVADDVFTRRRDFIKPPDKIKLLGPFGPNVATTEGKIYQFHVRVTAAAFNDANGVNDLVWHETMSQCRNFVSAHILNACSDPTTLTEDISRLTLSVICLAGFGQQEKIEYNQPQLYGKNTSSATRSSFFGAVLATTKYIFAILVFPRWMLWMSLRPAYEAYNAMESSMRAMIRSEQIQVQDSKTKKDEGRRGNLLTSLLKLSGEDTGTDSSASELKRYFSENEIMGNLFIYLLAGHETTANAMFYAMANLALYPDVQTRARAEVDALFNTPGATDSPTYSESYPKLQYLHGFMYEIFRLFPGALVVTKTTAYETSITTTEATTHSLPVGTGVYINAPAIHYAERYWEDAATLKPERWAEAWTEGAKRGIAAPDRTRQMHGTFITFSDGARACLGRKFAQSEMAAFLVRILRDCEIRLADGADRNIVEKQLRQYSAGAITLGPLEIPQLVLLQKRH